MSKGTKEHWERFKACYSRDDLKGVEGSQEICRLVADVEYTKAEEKAVALLEGNFESKEVASLLRYVLPAEDRRKLD